MELAKQPAGTNEWPRAAMPLSPDPINIGAMMQIMVEKGITADNVLAMEQLVKLHERLEDKRAEQEFAVAFVALQSEMPKVQASKAVPNKDGSVRYHFAPFEEIMRAVEPYLKKHGFGITFSQSFLQGPPQRLVQTCILQHIAGHSRKNEFAVRVGQGPPGSSEAQADGASSTYAKRFALCNALNIVVAGLDDDARAEGAEITADQAADLRRRVLALKRDEAKFLAFASATTYESIRADKLAMLQNWLTSFEKSPRKPAQDLTDKTVPY